MRPMFESRGRIETFAFDVPITRKGETREEKDDRLLLLGVRQGNVTTRALALYAGMPGTETTRQRRAHEGLLRLQRRGLVKRTEKGWEKV
jgi:hypothetical protein